MNDVATPTPASVVTPSTEPPRPQPMAVRDHRAGSVERAADVAQPSDLMSALVAAARDPRTNIEVVERLYKMHAEERAAQNLALFNGALARAQGRIPNIGKDSWNDQTKSHYAKLQAINKVAKPICAEEGLSLSFDETECPNPNKKDYTRYLCIVRHSAGHSHTYHIDLPADDSGIKGTVNKTPLHAAASTSQYAQRILTKRALNIAEEHDPDDDDGGHERDKDKDRSGGGRGKEPYTDANFDKNLPAWTKLVADKKKTPQQIVATLETTYTLQEKHKKAILELAGKGEYGSGAKDEEPPYT